MTAPLRVLILEDRPPDAELLALELRRAGFDPDWQRVETEADYLAALEPSLDLILSDYSLPQFDGMRALQLLQARALDIPFILISGTIGEEVAVEAMKRGAADYLLKDRLTRLGQAVTHALEGKRLRDEKRQAEERLRLQGTALESAANAIVITDRAGAILWVNPAFTRLTGYSAEEAIGQTPRLLKSGQHDDSFYQNLWKTLLAGQVWHSEMVNRRKDGTLYTSEETVTPVRDERGEISHFVAIEQDITERKRAEEALREADQRAIRDYARLLERLSQLAQTVGTARDLTAVYRSLREFAEASVPCNGLFVSLYDPHRQQRICVYSGGNGEEDDVSTLPPLPMSDSPQSRAIATGQVVVADDFQTAVAGNPVVTLGVKQDPRLPQSSLAVPLTVLGRVIGAFEVQSVERGAYKPEHVTAMRMAANLAAIATENVQMLERERQLRLGAEMSEERYRTLAEAAQDAIFIISRDDRVEYVNSFAAGQFGSRAEELVGKTRAALFPPHVAEEQSRTLQGVFETGNSTYAEAKTVYPTGEMWMGTRLAPIRNEVGEVRAVLGIARDITERKRAEEEIQRRAEQLAVLNAAALQIRQYLDPQEILRAACDQLQKFGTFASVMMLSGNERLEHLHTSMSAETLREYVETFGEKQIQFSLPVAALARAWAQLQVGQTIFESDLIPSLISQMPAEARAVVEWMNAQSQQRPVMLIPLTRAGATIGVLAVIGKYLDVSDIPAVALFARHVSVALENAQHFGQEQARRRELGDLYSLSRALADATDFETSANLVVRSAVQAVHSTFARLALKEGDEFVIRAAHPTRVLGRDLQVGRRESVSTHPWCQRVLEQNAPSVLRVDSPEITPYERETLFLGLAKTLCLVPLRVGDPSTGSGRALGLLMLGEARQEEREPFSPEKVRLAHSIGDQTASALRRAELFAELERAYLQTVLALANAVDAKDTYTANHAQRLAEMALAVGREMGSTPRELEDLRYGAILHDIGKIGVPDEILQKPSKLDAAEWARMQQHPEIGSRILAPVPRLAGAARIVRHHHERYDGKGYPDGLVGEAIPLGARILTVVDSYNAIVDARVYKAARSHAEAIAELERCAGTQFDPGVVEIFLRLEPGLNITGGG